MKQRCSFCGGRFGMIRHRHFLKQFCKAACKEQYLQDLADQRRAARQKDSLHRRFSRLAADPQ